MTFRKSLAIALSIAAALPGVALPGIASAQLNQSDGYKFREAVRGEKGTEVEDLLNKAGSVVINSRADNGETALLIVVQKGNEQYVRYLLARGADANIADKAGETPLLIAISKGRRDLVDALIAAHANVNLGNATRETPLILAVQRRNLQLVQALLVAGADPDRVDLSGSSARDYATQDRRSPAFLKAIQDAPKKKPAVVSGPKL